MQSMAVQTLAKDSNCPTIMVERVGRAGEETRSMTRFDGRRDIALAHSVGPLETAILATGPDKT
jgi:hypothetical protein